jgi:hypothetical protein
MISHRLPASFPMAKKKRGNRETYLKEKEGVVELTWVHLSFPFFHGGFRLARVGGHMRAPAKSRKSEVYDNDKVSYLSCAQGPCISSPSGGYVMVCTTFYEQGFGVPSH